jgi:hypothetical protein
VPLKVPIKVEMTSPESKLRYKITYPNGNEKWVKERPGHKSDKWKMRERKLLLREPAVKDYFKRMEAVINKYLDSNASEDDIQQVARDFEVKMGWNKARMITRRLAKTEKRKLSDMEPHEKERQQDIVDALGIAVDFVARRRRDKPKTKKEESKKAMDRFLRIARKVVSFQLEFNPSGLYEEHV